jgi:hypothetical protein
MPSAHGKNEADAGLVPRAARDWYRSISLSLARVYARPQNYLLLKYEDLVSDPNGKTKKLCDFIGVDFEEDRMLSFSDFAHHKDNTSFAQLDNLQQSYRVYRPDSRKQFLDAEEHAIVRDFCGELAWAVGYDDEAFATAHDVAPSERFTSLEPIKSKLYRWSKNLLQQQKSRP